MTEEHARGGKAEDPVESPSKDRLEFHYIKANLFRVIHADGVHGGVTPHLKIQMALFSERMPIPQKTVHRISEPDPGGGIKLGDEILEERVARKDVVREVEAEVVMDVEVAKILMEWLGQKIKLITDAKEAETRAEGKQ